jgi:plastocyanin
MKKTTLLVIALVIIAAGVAFALLGGSDKNTKSNSTQPAQTAGTITYSNSSFSPASLTVKAGSKVTIKNDSSNDLQFDSDPHPQHTEDPELNVGIIGAGQSATITVTKTGNHGYHNHLNSGDTGTLIVE